MINYGIVRIRVVNEALEPFMEACCAYYADMLDDVAKARQERYRTELLALGTKRQYIDDFESYIKDRFTGVREPNDDEQLAVLGTLFGAAITAISEKLRAEGADVIITLSTADEELIEGKTDEEIRTIIEDMYGQQPDPKK